MHPGKGAGNVLNMDRVLYGRRDSVVGGSHCDSAGKEKLQEVDQTLGGFVSPSPGAAMHEKEQRSIHLPFGQVEIQRVSGIASRPRVVWDILNHPPLRLAL